jgi:glycosyltransferase involved in cell wall biosynthesis
MTMISIVAPVFNEGENLPEFFRRMTVVLDGIEYESEVIVVDDGSSDNSLALAKQQSLIDKRFKTISFSRNFGHQSAILAGITHSSGAAVIILDSDLQDPPELIPDLLAKWKQGTDVVHAQRIERKGESVFKKASAILFYRFIDWMSDTTLPRNVGDFRLMDRRVVDVLLSLGEKSLYLRGMVAWVGFNQDFISFDRDARYAGKTKYSFSKMSNLALDALLSFSDRPLRVLTQLGLLVTSLSFMLIMFFLGSLLLGSSSPERGWLSIVLISLFLGGVQLICFGVLGEYIGRIYREAKNRPLFIIDDRNSNHDQ